MIFKIETLNNNMNRYIMTSLIPHSDCHSYTRPLCYDIVTSTVYLNPKYDKPTLDHVVNLSKKKLKFKSEALYIYYVIHYIKENILMKLPDLRKAKIYINAFDKKNVIHQFILSVSEFIADLLKLKCTINAIFIYIQYGNEIKFIGII